MKASTLSNIKKELQLRPADELLTICLRLAKYKKENKELLTYLLFEADDEVAYIQGVKDEMNTLFEAMNPSNVFLMKKTIRKVLNATNKFIRYSGSKQTEVELLINFCQQLRERRVPIKRSRVLGNIYDRQVLKIIKSYNTLHEDLQFDYTEDLEELQNK